MKNFASVLSAAIAISFVCLAPNSVDAQGFGSDSYRNVTRQTAPTTKAKNPFSKLMDFSFKKPATSTKPPSLMERLDKLSLFKKEPGQRQTMNSLEDFANLRTPEPAQPRFSLSKLFPPKDPAAPKFFDKLSAKTSSLFSKPRTWTQPKAELGETNWEQASREIRQSAQNLLRDSRERANSNQSVQPPLRSANRQPNIRY